MKKFAKIFAVLLSVIFTWTGDCEAGPAGYRIVAYINEGGTLRIERAVVRSIQTPFGDSARRIDPRILSSLVLLPNTSGTAEEEYVSVADKKLPAVGAGVKMNPAEEIEIAGRRFFRREFSINGEAGEADLAFAATAESGNLGLRSIVVEGAGYAVFDAEGLSPAAGRMHLVCRALPALWRTDVSEEDLKTEISAAWTRIP